MTLSGETRPYEGVLRRAAAERRVLHREDIYGSGPPNEHPNAAVLQILRAHAGASFLDVGCGIGAYVAALGREGFLATGLEVNPAHVARARELGRRVEGFDGHTIPFPNASFECVAAIEVLEHVPDWDRLLSEMVRVASRTVLLSVPNIGVLPGMARHLVGPWHLLEATHVNFFTREMLAAILETRYPNLRREVSEYGAFVVNGERFHNHLLAVLQIER